MDMEKRNRWVVKSNQLVQASYKLNVQESRVILLLASIVKKDDTDFNLIKLRVKDFIQFVGIEKCKDSYARVKKVTRNLGKKTLDIKIIDPDTNKTREISAQWLASSDYLGDGYVELEFSNKLKPFLLQLNDNFTKYHLQTALCLNESSYSLRIYELLKQWQKPKQRTFELDQFKYHLAISPDKYKVYAGFKNRVLKPAIKEINQKTELNIILTEIKKNRKIVALKFNIKVVENKDTNLINDKDIKNVEYKIEKITHPELYDKMISYFLLTPQQARESLEHYSAKYISDNLNYVEQQIRKGSVDKIGAYTLKALKEDFRPQLSLFETEKNKKDEQQQREELIKDEKRQEEDAYYKFRRLKLENVKEQILPAELKKIEKFVLQEVQADAHYIPATEKVMVRIGVEKRLAEKYGVPDIEGWKENFK